MSTWPTDPITSDDRNPRQLCPISCFINERDNQAKKGEFTWASLSAELVDHKRGACTLASCVGKDCPGKPVNVWSPALFRDNHRTSANATTYSVLSYDVDKVARGVVDRIHAALVADGIAHVIASSHNHRDLDGEVRVRVVIQTSRATWSREFKRIWTAVAARYGIHFDPNTKDFARLYYGPSCPSDATPIAINHDGKPLNIDGGWLASATPDPVVETTLASLSVVGAPASSKKRPVPSQDVEEAAAKVLAAAWPKDGGYRASLHLAGALAHAGWPVDEIVAFVLEVRSIVEPHNTKNQLHSRELAERALAKIDRGENVTGWTRLGTESVGESVVSEACAILWPPVSAAEIGVSTAQASSTATGADGSTAEIDGLAVTPPTRATIQISTDIEGVVDASIAALAHHGGVYVRGRNLVHVVRDKSSTDWLRRPAGMPVIEAIESARLREVLGAAASYFSFEKKTKTWKPAMVPAWVVETITARGQWALPQLEGIADAPVMRADGTILDVPGYDAATRLIFDPCGIDFPRAPGSPSQEDARAALAILMDPVRDFPFVAGSDSAAVAAMILTIVGRPAIDGPTPIFASDANTPGSGKTLLVDVVATIATGRSAPKVLPTDSEEETRKRALAFALESPQMIAIDNVVGDFGTPAMAAMITGTELKDRTLGVSKSVTASLRAVWSLTGNNVAYKCDLGRRVVAFSIDPKVENPEDRTGFAYPDLLAHVSRERPSLVVAALTVLRGYVVAGRPAHDKSPKGGFESWDKLVRGALLWAGAADPLGGVARIRESGDSDVMNLRALLTAWRAFFGDRAVTVSDAMNASQLFGSELGEERAALRSALVAIGSDKNGKLTTATIGYALRRLKGRSVGGMTLTSHLNRNDVAVWRVDVTS